MNFYGLLTILVLLVFIHCRKIGKKIFDVNRVSDHICSLNH